MVTIKSYTDLEQSKKLAEILPIESADMCWQKIYDENHLLSDYRIKLLPFRLYSGLGVPAWSLAALLGVLPFHLIVNIQRYAFSMHKGLNKYGETYMLRYNIFNTDVCLYETDYYNNSVDACYELILKLHELKML